MFLSLVKSLKLHTDKVWDLDCYKGLVAAASTDRRVKIVSVARDGRTELVDELDDTVHKKTVRSVAWRPHSMILAAASFDSTISIWAKDPTGENEDSLSNRALNMELLAIIEGHENEVKSVAWSYDGSYLATCSRDKSVWIWETDEMGEEYECISVLQEHTQDVKHVVWHPHKLWLASSSYDDTIRIWKEFDDDWECAALLNGHEGTVWGCDFEKDESSTTRICSGGDDGTVRVWKYTGDDEDGQQEWVCEAILPPAHTRAVYSVSWGKNGLVASTGSDGKIVLYKEESDGWQIIAERELSHSVYECNVIKWIEVNRQLLLATGGDDGYINLWSLS